jgi:hypothetical protein
LSVLGGKGNTLAVTLLDMAPRKPPGGWLEVPISVAITVQEGVDSLAPGLTLSQSDAWGAGISPRVVRMARTLLMEGARLGPTSLDGLKRMLMTANDTTYSLLGGGVTERWAFAPSEFGAWEAANEALPEDATEADFAADPGVRRALANLEKALKRNVSDWKREQNE